MSEQRSIQLRSLLRGCLLVVALVALAACVGEDDNPADEPALSGDPGNFEGCPPGCEAVCDLVGEDNVAVVLQSCAVATGAVCWSDQREEMRVFRGREVVCAHFDAECLRSPGDGQYRCTLDHPGVPPGTQRGACIGDFLVEHTPRGRVVGTDCAAFGGTCDEAGSRCVGTR